MTERVITQIENGVAEVILNRPDKHNGLDMAMFEGVVNAGAALMDHKDVRCVILRGEGPSFCAGLDFQSVMQEPRGVAPAFDRSGDDPADHAQLVAMNWRRLPMPVIAAVQGVCYGGGLQLALGADIRIAHPKAKLSVMEIKYGLIPDMAASVTLRELVGSDVAKELTWTGRVVSGAEANDLGMVTRTHDDPLAECRKLAAEIAGKSPDAIREGKRLLNMAYEHKRDESLLLEAEMQQALLGSANQMEAVRAAMMKDAPNFKDPE